MPVKEASNTFPPSVTFRVTVVDVGRRRILVGNGIWPETERFFEYPVVSYPRIFRTQTIRTQAQTFRTQRSGRFVPNKLWHKMFRTNINIYFIYPSNRKKANF